MSGADIPDEIISLVIIACIGLIALALFSDMSTSSLAVEQGKPFFSTQRSYLPSLAELFPVFLGGGGLLLGALWMLSNAGR